MTPRRGFVAGLLASGLVPSRGGQLCDCQWRYRNLPTMQPNLSCVSCAGDLVAFGMQGQGDKAALPKLVGFHQRAQVAASSPRGGKVQFFDSGTQRFIAAVRAEDVCAGGGFARGEC